MHDHPIRGGATLALASHTCPRCLRGWTSTVAERACQWCGAPLATATCSPLPEPPLPEPEEPPYTDEMPDVPVAHGYCPTCREVVLVDLASACLWCGRRTVKAGR